MAAGTVRTAAPKAVATGAPQSAPTAQVLSAADDTVVAGVKGNANPANTSNFHGGAYGKMIEPPRDGLVAHHMPANSVNGLPRREGPAIQMEVNDHKMTSSWGNRKESQLFNQVQGELVEAGEMRKAMFNEIMDIRRIEKTIGEPGKYRKAIREMLDYTKDKRLLEKK